MADIGKVISGNAYGEGDVCLYNGLTNVISLTARYSIKDWSELITSLSAKFRNYLYYIGGTAYAGSTSDVHAPAAATAAVVTYTADTYGKHVIHAVAYSYSAAPTGGRLTVENGSGTIIFDQTITAAGPGYIEFDGGLKGSANTAMIITLASGAGAVVGKVNVFGHEVQ